MIENFVVFIITHGRAGNIATEKALIRHGYTGPIYFVIDNEDKQRPQYEALYGDRVKVFDKKAYADHVDEGDNFDNRRSTTHARNACFDIAEQLGYEWFLVLDDDYIAFDFRTTANGNYPRENLSMRGSLEKAIAAVLEYFQSIPALSIATAQGGDFLGGAESSTAEKAKPIRKVMNTFFCCTNRRFDFRSRLFLTIPLLSVTQKQTQTNAGGMSDAYLESGTYVKSFYSVMYAPHSVKVSMVGQANRRIHHRVNWKTAVPQIVSESCRKV